MDFKQIYCTPFNTSAASAYSMVFSINNNHAFDIEDTLNDEDKQTIIKILNSSSSMFKLTNLHYDKNSQFIYQIVKGKRKNILQVRGWGHLIGIGGLKLPELEAIKIQDNFANWIIKKLTNKE